MGKTPVIAVAVQKIMVSGTTTTSDLLAVEEPLEIRLGYGPAHAREQKSISVTMRTPGNDFELALGFLFTEGIIENASDITQIRYCTELNTKENSENIVRVELHEHVQVDMAKLSRNFYTTSSCGVCGKASIESVKTQCRIFSGNTPFKIPASLLHSLPGMLRGQQTLFEHTGGIHACALFDTNGNLLLMREDVGRHNALDKLIGAAIGKELVPLNRHIILLSGRASFELLQKAAMAGVRVVCAIGAPSSLAVQTANEFDITLIGFLRNDRFNIYSRSETITIGS
ncbi:MAG: formate dehydrogenase accessory sulfurtransferase FdhD [Bacteroidia bacterium]|nr:formate dehydrogenase accessory sulfurtransferase FdhD [Bacteroidia bacterium]